MKVFEAEAINAANRKLFIYVQKRFPSFYETTSNRDLKIFIEKVRNTAKKYDVINENDVSLSLDFSIMYGENFWEQAWSSDVTSLNVLSGSDKMEILRQRVK